MSTELPHSDLTTLHSRLLEEIPPGSTVLDVGAGLAKYHELLIERGCKLTLVDAHKPYLDERKARFPDVEIIHDGACVAIWKFVGCRQWDVALAIDFLEHLDRPVAEEFPDRLREVADRIVLFVPEGHHPQTTDHYNLGGDHWQTHRSEWYAADLEDLGFTVERWLDFHRWAKDRGCDPGALWATWRRS